MYAVRSFNRGLRVLLLLAVPLFFSCNAAEKNSAPRTKLVIGTVCTVNLFESGTDALYAKLFARLDEIDRHLSAHRDDSDIAAVNAAAGIRAVAVGADTLAVLSEAKIIAEKTAGAFDPTIGVLAKLWNISVTDMTTGETAAGRVPSAAEIQAVLPLVDYRKLHVDTESGTVFLEKQGMYLDAGGIAKGYAADALVQILKAEKVPRALIDLGGNIYAHGYKAPAHASSAAVPWRVGIKNPVHPENPPVLALETAGESVVTSGIYERYFEENGIRYHHIFNPFTGYPVENELASCSVIGESSMRADALSTAVFVMGAEKGLAFLSGEAEIAETAGKPSVAGICITADARILATPAADKKLTVLDDSFRKIGYGL